MHKCTNCEYEFDEPHRVRINMGIAIIDQVQCPKCQCPIETEITKQDIKCPV